MSTNDPNTLTLAPSKGMRRTLVVSFNAKYSTLHARIQNPANAASFLAYVSGARLAECRVGPTRDGMPPDLWLGHTSFDLTESESERVESFLAKCREAKS